MSHKPSADPIPLTLEDIVVSYKGKALSADELAHSIELGLKVLSNDSPDEIANDLRGFAQLCRSLNLEDAFAMCDLAATRMIGSFLDQLAVRVNRTLRPEHLTVTVNDRTKADRTVDL